jgi:hypothetical protein
VVAGGREPVHWEAYPHHQFLHTIGALPCCSKGGCWRARTAPLGDGDELDAADSLCIDVVDGLPRCMHMITGADVVRRIETYFTGRVVNYLTPPEAAAAARGVEATKENRFDAAPLTVQSVRLAMEHFIQELSPYPGGFAGRGLDLWRRCQPFTNARSASTCPAIGCSPLPLGIWASRNWIGR